MVPSRITIPGGVSGDYYIIVHTDSDNRIFEGDDENNNVRASDNPVSILPDRTAQMALAVNVEFAFCAVIENANHLDDSSCHLH